MFLGYILEDNCKKHKRFRKLHDKIIKITNVKQNININQQKEGFCKNM